MSGPGKRARDADRDHVVEIIEGAFADGQLSAEDREDRTARALTATTMTQLRNLVQDLQTDRPLERSAEPKPDRSRQPATSRRGVLALIGGAAALTLGLGVWAGWRTIHPTEDTDLTTPEDFADLVAAYEAKFETTDTLRAVIYPDYAVLEVPLRGSAPRHETWVYRDGSWTESGSASANSSDTGLVDLGDVDAAALAGSVRAAIETLNVEKPDNRYFIIDHSTTFETEPMISVYLSNKYGESGYLLTTLSGAVVATHPYEPPG